MTRLAALKRAVALWGRAPDPGSADKAAGMGFGAGRRTAPIRFSNCAQDGDIDQAEQSWRIRLERQSQRLAALADETLRAKALDEQAVRSRAEKLSQISHEVRTPLNAIMGFADLMAGESFGPLGHEKYREYVCHVQLAGSQILSALEQIIALSEHTLTSPNSYLISVDLIALLQEHRQKLSETGAGWTIILPSPGESGQLPARLVPDLAIQAISRLMNVYQHGQAGRGQWSFRTAVIAGVPALHLDGRAQVLAIGHDPASDQMRRSLKRLNLAAARSLLDLMGAQLAVSEVREGDCLAIELMILFSGAHFQDGDARQVRAV